MLCDRSLIRWGLLVYNYIKRMAGSSFMLLQVLFVEKRVLNGGGEKENKLEI